MLMAATGCRFDKEPVSPGREQVVVHSVLDPSRFRQSVLLERLLTGREAIDDGIPFDSLDPIASHGGSPVSNALVIVFGPSGDSAVATERLVSGRGTGMYEFDNSATDVPGASNERLEIARGRTYRLHIVTPDDRVLTAMTTVPDGPSASGPEFSNFNRDRQSIFLFWDPVPLAERYAITIRSPRGGFSIFVDSLEFLLSGDLKNTSNATLADVFVPGFTQEITVAAVDRNYHNYFRSENDPYTGRGLLTHVTGGLGVFGSAVVLRHQRVSVTANIDHVIEGTYARNIGAGPQYMRLFVNATANQQMDISGDHGSGLFPAGMLGTLDRDSLKLALLRGQSARDTAMFIEGTLRSGIIRGRIRGGGDVEYRQLMTP